MKLGNPVSEKDRAEATALTVKILASIHAQESVDLWSAMLAQALADARSEGYVAGVEDAVKIASGYKLFNPQGVQIGSGEPLTDAIKEALLGPKVKP